MSHSLHRILVIDDDADIQDVVAAVLEDFGGYTVEACISGVATIARAPIFRPDLILLDLNLPRKDGREVLQEIKNDADLKRIPVVVLTTSESESDIIATYGFHANCYINKPVDMDQFIKIVQMLEEFWFTIVKLPPRGINSCASQTSPRRSNAA